MPPTRFCKWGPVTVRLVIAGRYGIPKTENKNQQTMAPIWRHGHALNEQVPEQFLYEPCDGLRNTFTGYADASETSE